MSRSLQQNLPPMPLQRVESRTDCDLNLVESDEKPGDLSLDAARQLAGAIVADVLHDTRSQLKELGDKGAVGRWKSGTENPNLARLIQKADARKAMAKALLKSCDDLELVEEWRVIEKVKG